MLLGRLQTSHTLWPYLTRLWHDTNKDQSAIRPMTSLNNFYLRDQYPKPWCVWRPLNTSKVESKLLSCLTLESNAYQIHLDILFLSWCTLKGQSRLRSHLSPFLSRIQSTGKVMSHVRQSSDQSCVHIWPRLIPDQYTVNPFFHQLFHLCVKENQHAVKHSLLEEE